MGGRVMGGRVAGNYFNYTALNYALWSGTGFNVSESPAGPPTELPPPCPAKARRLVSQRRRTARYREHATARCSECNLG